MRLSDIAAPTKPSYQCCRCGSRAPFDDCWTVIPFSASGHQMMQGYIHCGTCRQTNPLRAWREAHDKEAPHRGRFQ